ncbi:lipopolysaccharide biosynthesis protein [Kineococcus gynurae]|uniref:Lipopolysaccharide biosynthesis protein n=1 Tax=Kineococcus gynurae TaxID=452979 RepID=A0ABV5LXU6_9ACTN
MSSSGAWRVVGTSAAAKFAVMAVSGAISVVSVRLILEHFGVAAYAQYGLLTSVAALLPFADLGMAAAVINAVAGSDDPGRDEHVRRTIVSALRVIAVSALVIVGVGALITALQLWPTLLGEGLLPGSGPVAALACLVVFAATLPLAVGQRVLTGLGLNHVQILLQGLASPLFATSVVLLVVTGGAGGGFLAVCSYGGALVVAGIGATLAARRMPGVLGSVLRDVPRVKAVPGIPVFATAWPMVVQMIALPIAMQTDRLLLSHLTDETVLARYNLASSLFGIVLQTISAAGIALWPVFARARSTAEVRSPIPMSFAFCGAGLLVALPLALLMPWIAPFLSDGQIRLDAWLVWAFVAFVAVQAAKYPVGMYLTDAKGLRFQVLPIVVMVPLNLGVSWALVAPLGAAGPVIGSTLAVLVCQVVPNALYVRRDLARRRAAGVATPAGQRG